MSDLIPFGKHKGRPIDALLDDREYTEWLIQQGWFRERYGNIYQIVINNGQEVSDTPEHNAMQVRFLDADYSLAFTSLIVRKLGSLPLLDCAWKASLEPLIGLDVRLRCVFDSPDPLDWESELFKSGYTREGRKDRRVGVIYVEIKPSVGDDFPSVLRQIKRARMHKECESFAYLALLVDQYTGRGATREQFCQVFENEKIHVVFADEVGISA